MADDSLKTGASRDLSPDSWNLAPDTLKTVGDVLRHLQDEAGRQVKKTKLYEDIKRGLLRKEGGAFKRRDVERYAASLPRATTPDGRVEAAAERQRRGEEADIRIKEAKAAREEKRNAILDGQYVASEDVDQELAARAVALNMGLKTQIEAAAVDVMAKVGGEPNRAMVLVREMDLLIDAAHPLEIDVHLYSEEEDENETGGKSDD